MAAKRHAVHGVLLNRIIYRRKRLGPRERRAACTLRDLGHPIHEIAHLLGTHHSNICKALKQRPGDDRQPLLL